MPCRSCTRRLTESRKAGNPVVLGFQGRSQLEELYGRKAEAMLSQPATKIFLRTDEANSAKWISETIGDIEIERLRESRMEGHFPSHRHSRNYQFERPTEPLVMASEIQGLPDLHGYLKSGNQIVRLSFPYIELPKRQEALIVRKLATRRPKEEHTQLALTNTDSSDGARSFPTPIPAQPHEQLKPATGQAASDGLPFLE